MGFPLNRLVISLILLILLNQIFKKLALIYGVAEGCKFSKQYYIHALFAAARLCVGFSTGKSRPNSRIRPRMYILCLIKLQTVDLELA